MINFSILQAFLTTANCRSITQAANMLYLSQSTVSGQIKQLEASLNAPLFVRRQGMRFVELTPQGEELLPIAEKWLGLYADAQDLTSAVRKTTLVIGAPDSLSNQILLPFYQQVVETNPYINLSLKTYQSPEIYTLLSNREIDVGFSFRLFQYSNIRVFPAFREQLKLVCHKGYYPDGPLHPTQLSPKDQVHMVWSPETQMWYERWWQNVKEKPRYYVDTPALIQGLMDFPRSWTTCPESVVLSLQKLPDIEVHELSIDAPDRVAYILLQQRAPMHKVNALNSFYALFKIFAKTLPWSTEEINHIC